MIISQYVYLAGYNYDSVMQTSGGQGFWLIDSSTSHFRRRYFGLNERLINVPNSSPSYAPNRLMVPLFNLAYILKNTKKHIRSFSRRSTAETSKETQTRPTNLLLIWQVPSMLLRSLRCSLSILFLRLSTQRLGPNLRLRFGGEIALAFLQFMSFNVTLVSFVLWCHDFWPQQQNPRHFQRTRFWSLGWQKNGRKRGANGQKKTRKWAKKVAQIWKGLNSRHILTVANLILQCKYAIR